LNDSPLQIEIAYAEPERGIVKILRLPPGSCIADALRLAALDPDFAGIDFASFAFGIFGKAARAEQALQMGDRIEIYRPLAADPKQARRERAKRALK
jgi:putative ubiquitin-RnfH superfamily antitoxin RatB of RatAB toxin-antitoxin module